MDFQSIIGLLFVAGVLYFIWNKRKTKSGGSSGKLFGSSGRTTNKK